MNCCSTEDEKRIKKEKSLERKRIKEALKKIEKRLNEEREERRKLRNKVTILLLGTAESGKTTFFKQMEIIHGKGFDVNYRKSFIQDVFRNIYRSMQSMIAAMDMLKIEYESPNIMDSVELIRDFDCQHVKSMSESHASALKALWADEGIQKCFSRSREYQLTDTTEYFLSQIDHIADTKYLPDTEDILRVYVPTTGIVEKVFQLNKLEFTFVDVGGQKSERKKWLCLFENINSIIFISALSEYDQTLNEDKDKNRLQEAVTLFGLITSNLFVRKQSVLLFLNKLDQLEEKIMNSHLADYFPNFNGPEKDSYAAREFIKKMFLDAKLRREATHIRVYIHYIQATSNTKIPDIKAVFNDVKKKISCGNFKRTLRD